METKNPNIPTTTLLPIGDKKGDINLCDMSPENKQNNISDDNKSIAYDVTNTSDTELIMKIKDSSRCNLANCNKKLGLLDSNIKCKCGDVFCSTHRYSNKHNCSFDYKKDNKEKMEKSLTKVVADKVIKI